MEAFRSTETQLWLCAACSVVQYCGMMMCEKVIGAVLWRASPLRTIRLAPPKILPPRTVPGHMHKLMSVAFSMKKLFNPLSVILLHTDLR